MEKEHEQDLKIDGSAGGPFVIEGFGEMYEAFGDEPGSVTFGTVAGNVTHWSTRWIKGQLPSTAEPSEVTVTMANGKMIKGRWPQPIRGAFAHPSQPIATPPPTEPAPKK